MSIASRKEREFKAREKLILDKSYEMIVELGYIGFTIDKLAKEIDYAKGTIYKHFTCKEDIIAKLLYAMLRERNEVVNRCFELEQPTRIKFLVANTGANLFHHLNPNMHKLVHISYVGSIWNKAQDKLREEHRSIFLDSFVAFKRILKNAQENGDIELGEHIAADIFYSVVSMDVGYDRLSSSLFDLSNQCDMKICAAFECELNHREIYHMLNLNIDTYLDGLGWKPLSTSENYRNLIIDNVNDVYADLVAQLEFELF